VRNPAGKALGEINDLIVDMNTGEVRYAILEFDPGVFTPEKLFAVGNPEYGCELHPIDFATRRRPRAMR
jgi:PRC-barrel domain